MSDRPRRRLVFLACLLGAAACATPDAPSDGIARVERDFPGFSVQLPDWTVQTDVSREGVGQMRVARGLQEIAGVSWEAGTTTPDEFEIIGEMIADVLAQQLMGSLSLAVAHRAPIRRGPDFGTLILFDTRRGYLGFSILQCAKSNVQITAYSLSGGDRAASLRFQEQLTSSIRCKGADDALVTASKIMWFDPPPPDTALLGTDPPQFWSLDGRMWTINEIPGRVRTLIARPGLLESALGGFVDGAVVRGEMSSVSNADGASIDWLPLTVTVEDTALSLIVGGLYCEEAGSGYLVIYFSADERDVTLDRSLLSRFRCPSQDRPAYPLAQDLFPALCLQHRLAACILTGTLIQDEGLVVGETTPEEWFEKACVEGFADPACSSDP